MKQKIKLSMRIGVFLLLLVVLLAAANAFFRPAWLEWNNYNTICGFYEEPKNTVGTIFLGSSVLVNGIVPTELYEEYGICAYNLATELQPTVASYYWLEEAYRMHPLTLKTAVIDASSLLYDPIEAACHKALDGMKPSYVKLKASFAVADGDYKTAFDYLFPFVAYHTRWNDLTAQDFEKFDFEPINGTRGYNYVPDMTSLENASVIDGVLDENATADMLNQSAVYYIEKMASFCEKHNINLVLIKTPTWLWNSEYHMATEEIAEKYQIDFLDFNFVPLLDEIDYCYPLDSVDEGYHMNYFGASKLTKWLGQYLVETYDATDIRGVPEYNHMEEQLGIYHSTVGAATAMKAATDPVEYLSYALRTGQTVFVATKGDTSLSLTEEQRKYFKEFGLEELSLIGTGETYIAIAKGGIVVYEERGCNYSELSYTGTLDDGTDFIVRSGLEASCWFNDTEQAMNQQGINFVVYQEEYETVLDSCVFDTCSTPTREVYTADLIAEIKSAGDAVQYNAGSLKDRLQKYLEKSKITTELSMQNQDYGAGDLLKFLDAYQNDPKNVILIAVKDEASNAMTAQARALLSEYGLVELANLGYRESYLACIDGGTVQIEQKESTTQAATWEEGAFYIKSAGYDAGDFASIQINGVEYSLNRRGLNLVVYDKEKDCVINLITFDTWKNELVVPET